MMLLTPSDWPRRIVWIVAMLIQQLGLSVMWFGQWVENMALAKEIAELERGRLASMKAYGDKL